MSKIYPVGIQSFEEIRRGGYCYIDKTFLIYQLVKTGKYYFLSRPRRFGKSLLISTLEAYFLGKKELFQGLAMEGLEKDWTTYPVLHLDLNARKYEDAASLTAILNQHLESWEALYGDEKKDRAPEERFAWIIEKACRATGRNVVVLVDEYDKPMLQAIGNEPLLTDYRNTLKAFYGVLKSCDKYLRFALLTGVTKFSKVSVFSDLNNLEDISLQQAYNNLCGITEHELLNSFTDGIQALGLNSQMTYEETCESLRQWYDGYHFSTSDEGLYNPFSLLTAMKSREFGSYWFETGTPTFLVELLQRSKYDLHRLTEEMATADSLGGIDTMYTNPVPILYQSGYLTIKGYDRNFQIYRLAYPNGEVRKGFIESLLPSYVHLPAQNNTFYVVSFLRDLMKGDVESCLERTRSFFASIPNDLENKTEKHYQTIFYLLFRLMGQYVESEVKSSVGRADVVVQLQDVVYVFEFKYDGTPEEALAQIDSKQYAIPYRADGRRVVKIGVNFDSATRTIGGWKIAKAD